VDPENVLSGHVRSSTGAQLSRGDFSGQPSLALGEKSPINCVPIVDGKGFHRLIDAMECGAFCNPLKLIGTQLPTSGGIKLASKAIHLTRQIPIEIVRLGSQAIRDESEMRAVEDKYFQLLY
jgi:hypothetical protein